jgi:hypothetical protein
MKLILQVLVAIILHPVALVLMYVNLAGRDDLSGTQKIVWALATFLIWGIGPIVYITFGKGALW